MTPNRLDQLASIVNDAKNYQSVALYLDTHEALAIFDLALDGMTFRESQMEVNMQNRDYFVKPIQGNGRSSHDYGRTHLVGKQDDVPNWGRAIAWALPTSLIAWGTVWAIWVMLP